MKFVADFHIHSKYSRATSPQTDLENLDKWAKIKGVKVLGTGDFTHPGWFSEIKEQLEPAESGLFKLKKSDSPTRFILTSEISCIYSKNGRVRKIHILVFAPSLDIVEKINAQLGWIGNLKSDGRPILGLDAKELAKIVLNTSQDCLVVPAHIWTPWFSLFGSKSGFDTTEECFEEYTKYIYAFETGLSSDPKMNWRLSALDNITLISNSDAHSPQKIGREANVFEGDELSYKAIVDAIKHGSKNHPPLSTLHTQLIYTIEFFPEEGKYHWDGHRNCNISFSPEETKKRGGLCPVCGKPLTIGVLSRVEELADRPSGFKPNNAIPFKSLIPLKEIIGEAIGTGPESKAVDKEYEKLIDSFDNELKILLDISSGEMQTVVRSEIAEGIARARDGKVFVQPGYDGVYGKIGIFKPEDKKFSTNQKTLF